jgi:thymidylate synthase
MRQYNDLIKHVLANGTRKPNRTGVDTISTFNYNYEIDLNEGFPLLTTKEISWKNIVIENLWFLSGEKSIDFLKRHGCKFWDAWAEPENRNEVPSAYGNFWRHFPIPNPSPYPSVAYNDQIQWVLNEMRINPMSRRMVVSAWAPHNAQFSKLPPCHCMFIFNVQNIMYEYDRSMSANIVEMVQKIEPRLCLHLTQRSCDVALGVPYNIAGYALILHLMAQMAGLKPGIFAHTLVDAHIYTCKEDGSQKEYDHIPGLKEQITRGPKPLPKLIIEPTIRDLKDIQELLNPKLTTDEIMKNFVLEGYDPYPAIKFKVAV